MGMERLLPRLEDLPLMLSLLPRSATGQKLSVYTQLIHGPRRPGEVDGARERHLIIVDNGRSRMRNSPLREALYCIRCGACLNACPVFREIGGHAYVGTDGSMAPYPGPIGSVVSPGLLGVEQFGQLSQASSLCGACKDACPVDIDLPKLLTRVRAGKRDQSQPTDAVGLSPMSKIGLRAYGVIGSSPRLFRMSQTLGAVATGLVSPFSKWFRIPAFTGWGYSKDFPRVAVKPFHARFQAQKAVNAEPRAEVQPQSDSASASQTSGPAIERFCEELEALGGQARRVTEAELTQQVAGYLKGQNISAVLVWDKIDGLDQTQLAESGIQIEKTPNPELHAGITGAAAAIAETGTLLITSGKGQPLSASLLSEIHIAIIRSAQILWSLEEAFKRKEAWEPSAGSLITGPSRTADIEMTLTIGVHGPGQLVVFIIE
jgi:L-lactate dehydrogenase complex protein LldF